jgi:hypothetical protein
VSNIDDRPFLLHNEGGGNHWIEVSLTGEVSNRSAIGARVKITAGELTQFDHVRAGGSFLSGNDLRLHFGLGGHARVDAMEIRWPSGRIERLEKLDVDRILSIREKGGSPAGPAARPGAR